MTELDDLKATWQTLNRNLERQHTLALQQLRETKRSRFRSGFRPLVVGQILQIVCGALLALLGGSFWFDHIRVLHLVIYGISLHLYGIMCVVFAARDLYLVRQFDYSAPVLTLQKQIADLRAWHRTAALWFGIAGCFIWIPGLLMIFHALGADVWQHNPGVVGWLLLSGFVTLGIGWGIVAFTRRPGRENLARGLDKSATGWTVQRAQSLLEEIESFERE
jgi:hypothetical protein